MKSYRGTSRTCGVVVSVLCFFLLLPANSQGQSLGALDVVVGNSSNSALLWANFDELQAIQLNTDANVSSGFSSLAFHYNKCGGARLDIVAANTNGGDLRLYRGGSNQWQTSTSMCSTGQCPQRPDGLSTRNDGLLVAANTGAAGTAPALWFFRPRTAEPCEQAGSPFGTGIAGRLAVGRIADTAFVRVPGGGLREGDLVVSTESPSQIVVVRRGVIDQLLSNPTSSAVLPFEVLVPAVFFGSSKPAGLAFVPGSAGVGSSEDNFSDSEYLLVTVPAARILKLRFGSRFNYGAGRSVFDQDLQLGVPGLGNGPLGIAVGRRGPTETLGVVVDRQRGQAVRFRLDVQVGTDEVTVNLFEGTTCGAGDGNCQVIKANLQFPLGVAYNSDAVAALNCFGNDGCAISGALKLFLPNPHSNSQQTASVQLQSSGNDIVIGTLYLAEDTPQARNPAGELLFSGDLAGYKLPATCRGFDLDDDANTPALVPVVQLTKNFPATAGTLVNVQELLTGLFPQLDDCEATGSRMYHTSADSGSLVDKTVLCTNPSRGANGGLFSPFAICGDVQYNTSWSNQLARVIKAEVLARRDRLRTLVLLLPTDVNAYNSLRVDLLAKLDFLTSNPNGPLRQNNPTQANFRSASALFDSGATQIHALKGTFAGDTGMDANFYGDLLTGWVSLAFYSFETGGRGAYCPPDAIRVDEMPGAACR